MSAAGYYVGFVSITELEASLPWIKTATIAMLWDEFKRLQIFIHQCKDRLPAAGASLGQGRRAMRAVMNELKRRGAWDN